MRSLLLIFMAMLVGCGDAEVGQLPTEAPMLSPPNKLGTLSAQLSPQTVGPLDGRPYQYKVPSRHDKTRPTPLVVMLHGFSASGSVEELYLNISAIAESKTFLYAFPDGTQKIRLAWWFWNAMEWCCNFFKSASTTLPM